jgi:nitrilase
MSTSKDREHSSKCTVAVAQIGSTFNVETTLGKISECIHEAVGSSARLIVFPEATIGGYPKFHTFGASIGDRTEGGRDAFLEYFKGAITVPGPEIRKLGEMATASNIFIVIGVIEKSSESGTLYCTSVYIDPKDGFVGKHRKVMPTGSERLVWGQGDGSTLEVFRPTNIPGAVVGGAICWENYMPLLRYHMYWKNVNIYCAPTVDSRDTWPVTMQHIGLEGRTFVLSACQFARRKDYQGLWKSEGHEDDEMIKGGSMISGPLGNILVEPCRNKAGVFYTEIDLEECIRGKFDLDVVGHYAAYSSHLDKANMNRGSIFRLSVNTDVTSR